MAKKEKYDGTQLYNPIEQVPILGPWYGRLGRVKRILSYPCNPTPTIIVEAAFVGIPRMAWSLFKPDFTDYKYEQVKAGFSHHGRKSRMKIHEWSESKYPTPRGLGQAIFQGAEFAQRAGWYLAVIDAATEYVLNWASLTYQYAGCKQPGSLYADTDQPGGQYFTGNASNAKLTCWGNWTADGFGTGPDGCGLAGNGYQSHSFGVTTVPWETHPLEYVAPQISLVNASTGFNLGTMNQNKNQDGSHSYSMNWSWDIGPSASFAPRTHFSAGPGYFKVASCYWHAVGNHLPLALDLRPDPP